MKNSYTEAFKRHALSKVYDRGDRTIEEVALELNVRLGTLKGWMLSEAKNSLRPTEKAPERAQDWPLAARLKALQESYALSGEELNGWCRERGIFTHHLQQWAADFCQSKPDVNARKGEDKPHDSGKKIKALEAELRRKEKALAEAAALLVLQKKLRAFLGEEAS